MACPTAEPHNKSNYTGIPHGFMLASICAQTLALRSCNLQPFLLLCILTLTNHPIVSLSSVSLACLISAAVLCSLTLTPIWRSLHGVRPHQPFICQHDKICILLIPLANVNIHSTYSMYVCACVWLAAKWNWPGDDLHPGQTHGYRCRETDPGSRGSSNGSCQT